MTQAADSTASANASATLSGRELALKRRQAMALHGKTGAAMTASARQATTPRQAASVSVQTTIAATEPATRVSDSALIKQLKTSVAHKASRARREALSQSGKAALQTASVRPSGRVRPTRAAQAELAQAASGAGMVAAGCGCGCNGAPGGCGGGASAAEAGVQPAAELTLAASTRNNEAPTGRALARARRATLFPDRVWPD